MALIDKLKYSLFLFGIAITVCSCKKLPQHNKEDYPVFIRENHFEKEYNSAKWLYFILLGSEKTSLYDFNTKTYVVKDTICIACEPRFEYNIQDSLLELFFFTNRCSTEKTKDAYCKCYGLQYPNTFIYNVKRSELIAIAPDGIVPQKIDLVKEWFKIDDKTAAFPDTLRKYKDQLNPWLKIEAQRRGIID